MFHKLRVVWVAWALRGLIAVSFVPGFGQGVVRAPESNPTVYITKTGKCYHQAGCQYLSKSCIAVTLEEARKRGLRPCSRCNPPTEHGAAEAADMGRGSNNIATGGASPGIAGFYGPPAGAPGRHTDHADTSEH
jgi:hypothetical protein